MSNAITSIDIPGVTPISKGKVRDIFDLGDQLLLVTTDRISAYDSILPQGIPDKGAILTQMSKFWFETISEASPNHLISTDVEDFPEPFKSHPEILAKRSMLVKKTEPFMAECVVRGYLTGSGLIEYNENQMICGILLPEGLIESSKLNKPIFTPATKAQDGHDINISFDEMTAIVGGADGEELRVRSLEIYKEAAKIALERGVILADTKFEFGMLDDEIILIDEVCTPDSSRFWSAKDYQPGRVQDSYDKQFVRNYLVRVKWDKNPPAPDLPEEIIESTRQRYINAYELITGNEW